MQTDRAVWKSETKFPNRATRRILWDAYKRKI